LIVISARRRRRTCSPAGIACGANAPAKREAALVARGAEVWRFPTHRSGRIDLHPLTRQLGEAGFTSVLVEGGGELHAYMLARGLADQLIIYLAPKVIGGPARSWVGGAGLASLASAYRFIFDGEPVDLGGDLRLTAVPAPGPRLVPRPDPED
jgi:diaminohydroxyphosphoribosylaminopyrimidine deaminase / 5-amino-6-(5-phosphoribosylamino)uracil reductase